MLGKKLKLLRESKQKSQQQVCSALNIEQSTLANYENGKRIPKLEILIKIAEYYQCSVDFLLGLEETNDTNQNIDYANSKTDISLSDRIKSLRLSADMTQEEFGKKFGIVKSTVSLYESGKSTPNDQIKKQICDYFHVSLDYLLGVDRQGEPDYMNCKTETPSTSLTEQEQNIIDIFRNLTDDNKDIIVGELKKTLRDQRRYEDTDLSVADDERITAELNNPNFKGFSKKSDAG